MGNTENSVKSIQSDRDRKLQPTLRQNSRLVVSGPAFGYEVPNSLNSLQNGSLIRRNTLSRNCVGQYN